MGVLPALYFSLVLADEAARLKLLPLLPYYTPSVTLVGAAFIHHERLRKTLTVMAAAGILAMFAWLTWFFSVLL